MGLRKSIAGLKEDELITVVMEKAAGDYGFEILTAHAGEDRPVIERMRTLHMGSDGKKCSFGRPKLHFLPSEPI